MYALELSNLLDYTREYDFLSTCSLKHPVDNAVTFVRNQEWAETIPTETRLIVIVPSWMDISAPHGAVIWPTQDPKALFVLFHNEIYKNAIPRENILAPDLDIHPTSMTVLGSVGISTARIEGENILMKHMGNVVIGSNVYVGPYNIIIRAPIDSTIIDDGVKIGNSCIIGHGAAIGARTGFGAGVIIGGSAEIGKRCFFGSGSLTRGGIKICSDVMLGAGAVAVKDITEPGVYIGVPAQRMRDWDGTW